MKTCKSIILHTARPNFLPIIRCNPKELSRSLAAENTLSFNHRIWVPGNCRKWSSGFVNHSVCWRWRPYRKKFAIVRTSDYGIKYIGLEGELERQYRRARLGRRKSTECGRMPWVQIAADRMRILRIIPSSLGIRVIGMHTVSSCARKMSMTWMRSREGFKLTFSGWDTSS